MNARVCLFGLLQQINQVLLFLLIFCLHGLIFPEEYYSGLFHPLYTGLSNAGHINGGWVMVRSFSCPQFSERHIRNSDRPANLGFATPTPRIDIGFDVRPHLFKK